MMLREAADKLGVSPSTLRVQIANGKLRAVKRGRDWHVTPSAVLDYATERGRKVGRCTARHPMHAEQVRCENRAGHDGDHFHSFYMRAWSDEDARPLGPCVNPSCDEGCAALGHPIIRT